MYDLIVSRGFQIVNLKMVRFKYKFFLQHLYFRPTQPLQLIINMIE